jgi:putative transposase
MCQIFGYRRNTFYKHQKQKEVKVIKEAKVLNFVSKIREEQPRVGTRKMLPDLKENGLIIGRDRFFKVLKSAELLVKPKKKFSKTTYSNHSYVVAPNLIKNLQICEANQVWVSDITYIALQGGKFAYLFLTTDAYTRKIIG